MSITEDAFLSIVRAYGLVHRFMQPRFASFGISSSQWGVLRTLVRFEKSGQGSVRLSDLGDELLIQLPSVTGVVDRLERVGLVKREICPEDHRSRRVSLTKGGRLLTDEVLQEHSRWIAAALACLKKEEQRTLGDLLGRISKHLKED